MPLLCTLKPKHCTICNELFTPKSARQKYCSDLCKFGESYCQTCGVRFIRKQKTTGLFCSAKCWYVAYDKQNSKICSACGKSFSAKSGQKSCSYECAYKARRIAKRNTHCAQCKKPLAENCHPKKRFCTRSCAQVFNRNGGRTRPDGATQSHVSGYLMIKVKGRWMLEHRFVMEQKLGRPLEKHERVHHKDGNRSNNSLSNLELWKVKKKDPAGVRAADYHCPGCRCFEH